MMDQTREARPVKAQRVLDYASGERREPYPALAYSSLYLGAIAWVFIALAVSRVWMNLDGPLISLAVGFCTVAVWAGHSAAQHLMEREAELRRRAIVGLILGWLGIAAMVGYSFWSWPQ